jgi:hypothetical protein
MHELKIDDELWIRILRRLAAICRRSLQLPDDIPTIFKDGIPPGTKPIRGGQADVFKVEYDDKVVAVKRFSLTVEEEFALKKVCHSIDDRVTKYDAHAITF